MDGNEGKEVSNDGSEEGKKRRAVPLLFIREKICMTRPQGKRDFSSKTNRRMVDE